MRLHGNAALTLRKRCELALMVEAGCTLKEATASNVAPATAHRWATRRRETGPRGAPLLACLQDRSSRRRRSPRMLAAEEQNRICEVRERTRRGRRLIATETGHPRTTVHRTL